MSDRVIEWPEALAPPGSEVARAAQELCSEVSPPFLYHHAVRVFAWACLLAEVDRLGFDRELLYVACLMHDIGLSERYAGPRCFEHESARVARSFAEGHGWEVGRCCDLAEAIRLHMQPRVVPEDGVEAYLLTEAAGCDVSGVRAAELDPVRRVSVLTLAPRSGFKEGFTDLFGEEARRKPGCMADAYLQKGLARRIAEAPFDG
jgi:hypothetical protein